MVNTEDKFQEIYEKYKNLVMKVVYNRTKDYHLAQDICQETFVKLYGYQDHIIMSRVKSWLLVVASNMAVDYLKKSSTRKELLADPGQAEISSATKEVAELDWEHMENRQICSKVLSALREKNESWYEVLILAEYLGVPRKVLAKKRGISLSTVDNYLRKSIRWIKTNFQEEYEEL